MSDQIKLSVKDFRAIKEADIKLNGITVVSGVNGCGKSTLSKLMYYTVHAVNKYDSLVIDQLNESTKDVFHFVYLLENELKVSNIDVFSFYKNITTLSSVEFLLRKQNELVDYIKQLASTYLIVENKNGLKRVVNTLKAVVNNENQSNDFYVLINELITQIANLFERSVLLLESRSATVVLNELSYNFFDKPFLPNQFELSEYDVPVVSTRSKSVSFLHSIQNVAYFDSPIMLGVSPDYHQDYWEELNGILNKRTSKHFLSSSVIDAIIKSEIIDGDTEIDSDLAFLTQNLRFKRNDGAVYDLLEVATGVKSFSILQLLLKNGFLTKNTLLIIDEPEAHLHPQWIVEYARMIVLLNKEVGVKFFIASHSPDMISAIKYISEKEQTTQNLEYYLAEQTKDNPYLFNYKSLGTNIDPIFESFNIALDRINQYGISNESNDLF